MNKNQKELLARLKIAVDVISKNPKTANNANNNVFIFFILSCRLLNLKEVSFLLASF